MSRHVLRLNDNALRAFLIAAAIDGLGEGRIVRTKESVGKELPILICNTETAARKRAHNWLVSGSILLKTDPSTDENASNLDESDRLEEAVISALETIVPDDDRPQPLAESITAAAVAAGAVAADDFMVSAFTLVNVSAGFDEDEIWTLSVDFTATVIA